MIGAKRIALLASAHQISASVIIPCLFELPRNRHGLVYLFRKGGLVVSHMCQMHNPTIRFLGTVPESNLCRTKIVL